MFFNAANFDIFYCKLNCNTFNAQTRTIKSGVNHINSSLLAWASDSLQLLRGPQVLLLCIWTSKRVLCMPLAGQNHLLWCFNIFFHHKRRKNKMCKEIKLFPLCNVNSICSTHINTLKKIALVFYLLLLCYWGTMK